MPDWDEGWIQEARADYEDRECERAETLSRMSPGVRAQLKADRLRQYEREAAERAASERRKQVNAVLGGILTILIGIAVLLGVVYGLTKFVKWAWHS